jgi:periplasmic protein TonB
MTSVPRAFLASLVLHGGLFGGLAFALATEPGKPPVGRIDVAMDTAAPLDGEFDPIPASEPPAVPSLPRATEVGPVGDPEDPRLAGDAAPGAPPEGGASAIGVGGNGPRIRPRRASAPAPAASEAVAEEVAPPAPAPPAGPTVRARPLPDSCREPVYPSRERRLGVEGVVLLLARIDPRGVVGGVDVLESSGAVALDRAAVDAVLKWRFSPALEEGTAVDDALRLRVTFSLVDGGRAGVGR